MHLDHNVLRADVVDPRRQRGELAPVTVNLEQADALAVRKPLVCCGPKVGRHQLDVLGHGRRLRLVQCGSLFLDSLSSRDAGAGRTLRSQFDPSPNALRDQLYHKDPILRFVT